LNAFDLLKRCDHRHPTSSQASGAKKKARWKNELKSIPNFIVGRHNIGQISKNHEDKKA
jgi:hypothetical protein